MQNSMTILPRAPRGAILPRRAVMTTGFPGPDWAARNQSRPGMSPLATVSGRICRARMFTMRAVQRGGLSRSRLLRCRQLNNSVLALDRVVNGYLNDRMTCLDRQSCDLRLLIGREGILGLPIHLE